MTDWSRILREIAHKVTQFDYTKTDRPDAAFCVLHLLADEIERQAREPAIETPSVPLAQYQAAVAREDAACAERDAVQAELDMLRSREEASSAPTDRAVDAQSVDDLAREIREAATDEPRMEWRRLDWRERGFWHRIAANVLQREARPPAAYAVEIVGEHEIVFRGESWVPRELLHAANAAADRANTELAAARNQLSGVEAERSAAVEQIAALRSSERERRIAEVVGTVTSLTSPSWAVVRAADRLASHERARTAQEVAK